MLTRKLLLNTFGTKIAPYGFEYQGFQHHRWRFSRVINGEEQYIIIQRDIHGGKSFNVEISRGLGACDKFCDLTHHSYKDDAELENLLNLLGDHFIDRVFPELSKPKPQVERTEYTITEEMYDRLLFQKDKLVRMFMERHGLDEICDIDEVVGQLLSEVEQTKNKLLYEQEEKLIELAAVYGEIVIQTVGGKWMRKKDWTGEKEEIVVGSFLFTHVPLNPLKMVYCGWQEGGMKVLVNYMSYLSDYREWSARQRDEYGNGWQSPKTAEMVGESLLDKKAVDETIGKRMKDAGFGYCSENPAGLILEREQGMEKEVIQVRRDRWGRKAFFVIYSILEGRSVGTYRFRKFCFYQDGEDMRVQLGRVGEEMREALFQNIRIEAAWEIPSFRYHLTKDDKERFRMGKEEMAGRWRKENGLEKISGEEEILSHLAKRLDAMRHVPYEECREELMAMGAVFGDLLIREIGGRWREYEGWRMHQLGVGLIDLPANGIAGIGLINLPQAMVRYWEWEGGSTLVRAYRESVWQHEKWKKICELGGLEVENQRGDIVQ